MLVESRSQGEKKLGIPASSLLSLVIFSWRNIEYAEDETTTTQKVGKRGEHFLEGFKESVCSRLESRFNYAN